MIHAKLVKIIQMNVILVIQQIILDNMTLSIIHVIVSKDTIKMVLTQFAKNVITIVKLVPNLDHVQNVIIKMFLIKDKIFLEINVLAKLDIMMMVLHQNVKSVIFCKIKLI